MRRQLTTFLLIASLLISLFGLSTHAHDIHFCTHSHSTDLDNPKQYHNDKHDCLYCQHSHKVDHIILFQTEPDYSTAFGLNSLALSHSNLQNFPDLHISRAPPAGCLFA
ncbi:MAG: hypothetical protein DWP97_06655 [Calditrichaeota bacterium]|nr:MAG: hypothetical protein DWP97_06655 [Calditrichota bacterium]